jgi:hypothetical protein
VIEILETHLRRAFRGRDLPPIASRSVGFGAKGGVAPVLLLIKQEKQVEARSVPWRERTSYRKSFDGAGDRGLGAR